MSHEQLQQISLQPPSDRLLHSPKVRIVVYSSLHAQNSTLGEFLQQEPDLPSRVDNPGNSIAPLLKLGRDEILNRIANTDIFQSRGKASYEVDKLLISTVDISMPSLCSVADISGHLWRVVLQLWKVIVCGTGEADLAWANPASIVPLRVHSFATLLQLLGSSTLYFAKRGLTQLDGTNKWNLLSLSRVIALLFDESDLFGKVAKEHVSDDFFSSAHKQSKVVPDKTTEVKKPITTKEKRRRHVRSNFEINHVSLADVNSNHHSQASNSKVNNYGTWSGSSLQALNKKDALDDDFQAFLQSLPKSESSTTDTDSLKGGSDGEPDKEKMVLSQVMKSDSNPANKAPKLDSKFGTLGHDHAIGLSSL